MFAACFGSRYGGHKGDGKAGPGTGVHCGPNALNVRAKHADGRTSEAGKVLKESRTDG